MLLAVAAYTYVATVIVDDCICIVHDPSTESERVRTGSTCKFAQYAKRAAFASVYLVRNMTHIRVLNERRTRHSV